MWSTSETKSVAVFSWTVEWHKVSKLINQVFRFHSLFYIQILIFRVPYGKLVKTLAQINEMDNDSDKMKMLVSFLRLVLLYNPNELKDCVHLFLSASVPVNSATILAMVISKTSTKRRGQIVTDAKKTSYAHVVKIEKSGKINQQIFTKKRPPLYVTEVTQCLDQINQLSSSSKDSTVKKDIASAIYEKCDSDEAVAFIHSLQGNFTPFDRKKIFEALARAYTVIHSSGYATKRKSKLYRWVYANIVVTFEAHRDIKHVCEALAKEGVDKFPFWIETNILEFVLHFTFTFYVLRFTFFTFIHMEKVTFIVRRIFFLILEWNKDMNEEKKNMKYNNSFSFLVHFDVLLLKCLFVQHVVVYFILFPSFFVLWIFFFVLHIQYAERVIRNSIEFEYKHSVMRAHDKQAQA